MDDFAVRVAQLEKSVQQVGAHREAYLSSAITSAFSRAAGVNTSSGTTAAASNQAHAFRVSFQDTPQGAAAGDAAMSSFVDYSRYPSGRYDATAQPARGSAMRTGAVPSVKGHYANDDTLAVIAAAPEPIPYHIDPVSEAYATCPRCLHLERLEESLVVVEDQYRNEMDYLRRVIEQVDTERVDVVQRLRSSQDECENRRLQVLEKEKQVSDWRQRAIVAEEEVAAGQRSSTSTFLDISRRTSFAFDALGLVVCGVETESRTEILACEQVTRAALWSVMDANMSALQRSAMLIGLRRELQRNAARECEMRDVQSEFVKRQLEAAMTTSRGAASLLPSSGTSLKEKRFAQQAAVVVPPATPCDPATEQQPSALVRAALSNVSSIAPRSGRDGLTARSSEEQSIFATRQEDIATGRSQSGGDAAPELFQRSLLPHDLNLPNDFAFEEDDVDSGRGPSDMQEHLSSSMPPRQSAGEGENLIGSARDTNHRTSHALSEDVSFGDLDVDEATITGHPLHLDYRDDAATSLRHLQLMLSESEAAKKQIEGHLLTEQHYSAALQQEVDDLTLQSFDQEEISKRVRLDALENIYRLEMTQQSHRRLEARIQLLEKKLRSSVLQATTAMSASNNSNLSDGSASQPRPDVDVALLQKELSVLRKLYTEAKDESVAARRELQDCKLLLEQYSTGALSEAANPPKQQQQSSPVPRPSTPQFPVAPLPATSPLDVAQLADAVAARMQPQLSDLTSMLSAVVRQLAVTSDDVVATGTEDAPSPGGRHGSDDSVLVLRGGTQPGASQQTTDASATDIADPSLMQHDGSGSGALLSGSIRSSPSTQNRQDASSGSGFASLLLKQVRSASRMHQEELKHVIESSMREVDARMRQELAEQLRDTVSKAVSASTTPSPADSTAAAAVAVAQGRRQGAHTPPDLAGMDRSRTPVSSIPAGGAESVGALTPPHPGSANASSILHAPNTSAVGEMAANPDPLSLSKLHDALASMRNMLRNVLFSTTHNQKLLGEKLDELSIGQKSMMNEVVTATSHMSQSTSQVLLGSPVGSSPLGNQPHYTIPPALQLATKSPVLMESTQPSHDAAAPQRFPPVAAMQLTAEDREKIVSTFLREHNIQVSSYQGSSQGLTSPAAPPLPVFPRLPSQGAAAAHGFSQTSPNLKGQPHPSIASPTSAASQEGSGQLTRRPSHKWDEDEDDSPHAKLPKVAVAQAANSRWHQAKSKTPYDDDEDDD